MLEGTVSKQDYKLKMEQLDLELANTKSNIEDIQSNNTTTKYEIQRLKELKYKVGKTPINNQYTVQQVADMINEITVYPNKLIVDITVNDINYCDTDEHFDPNKEFDMGKLLPDIDTDNASGCADFSYKLPEIKL